MKRPSKSAQKGVDIHAMRRQLLGKEVGTLYKDAPVRVALVYPSPYPVAMASLGYQTIYRLLNAVPGVCCERAMFDSRLGRSSLITLESGFSVGDAAVIALSVATESELASAAAALIDAGVPPLERERRATREAGGSTTPWPLVIAGGPLTYADPSPLLALADVVLCGEAEESLVLLAQELATALDQKSILEKSLELPGALVPALGGCEVTPLPFATADNSCLPAFAQITTPHTEFGNMFLIEPARGCPRRCSFCVMEPRPFRPVSAEQVLARIPQQVSRVGLVGAALGHHRHLKEIMAVLVESGRGVSLSSLRADRLDEELVELLLRGGTKTMTIAADGASEGLRASIGKKIKASDLLRATELARRVGLRSVKLYAMVGLPDEKKADLDELSQLALEMSQLLPTSLAVSPFVPKARTTFANATFAPLSLIRDHLAYIRKKLHGRAELRATSVREAWIENVVARGGYRAGLAAAEVATELHKGLFQAWKSAEKKYALLK